MGSRSSINVYPILYVRSKHTVCLDLMYSNYCIQVELPMWRGNQIRLRIAVSHLMYKTRSWCVSVSTVRYPLSNTEKVLFD